MKLNQKGLAHIGLIFLAVLVVSISSFVGYRVYKRSQEKPTNQTSIQAEPLAKEKEEIFEGLPYSDESGKYTVYYPETWKIDVKEGEKFETTNGPVPAITATFTSPSGLSLEFITDGGGRGGDCPPRENDKPHDPNNFCPTTELIYREKTGGSTIVGIYVRKDEYSGELVKKQASVPLELVRVKYTDKKTMYYPGLDYEENQGFQARKLSLNDPQMGGGAPYSSLFDERPGGSYTRISISPMGESESFFEQTDVKEAEAILKSFRFHP